MALTKSNVPPIEDIDVEAMKARYAHERERRLGKRGQAAYVPPEGSLPDYSIDPHVEVAAREPIEKAVDVVVLGCGFGGTLAATQLVRQGVEDFLMLDTAGDFGGVWYWNRYPGIQCDNDALVYMPLLEETGYMPTEKYSHGPEIQSHAQAAISLSF